ncbi:MAG: NAD(+) diphosphatase [Propionibacteriaceae bacterium]|jgi:NAD+ diphosphatase|nr:NAD(+) diphosphatase [Propionibacteriaceae bacterium]
MTLWEAPSLIDFAVDPNWPRAWREGTARLLSVRPGQSPSIGWGDAVGDSTLDGSPAGLRSSRDMRFDPQQHFYLGQVDRTPVFGWLDRDDGTTSHGGTSVGGSANSDEGSGGRGARSGGVTAGRVGLRGWLARATSVDTELAMRAVALANFHDSSGFCSVCGKPTVPQDLGRSRVCQDCDSVFFPRTDPAIIIAITADERILLGHHQGWADRQVSVFAGFVEAGESLEQAVYREVGEEVGLDLAQVRYIGSQPWPMPRSLMMGFTATAVSTDARPDGEEITDARWFTRDQLCQAVADQTVTLPPPGSIASRLIGDWVGSKD